MRPPCSSQHSAEACVAATQKLLSESKPVLLTKTSLWEYLKRARLEALTPFFEHNGYTSSSDLANVCAPSHMSWVFFRALAYGL